MHDGLAIFCIFPPSYLIWKLLEIPPTLFSHSWALVIQFIKWQIYVLIYLYDLQYILHKLLLSYLIICASLLGMPKKPICQGWSFLFLVRWFVHLFFSSALASFCLSWHPNCWKAFVLTSTQSWRQRVVHFIKRILEHLLGITMQTMEKEIERNWKTIQHNVILLKKHSNLCKLTSF